MWPGGPDTLLETGFPNLGVERVLELQRLAGNRAVTDVIQRKKTKKKATPTPQPELTIGGPQAGRFETAKTYEEMRGQVVLKGGKKGQEKAKDTKKGNKGILYDYVKKATIRAAQIRAASDTLAYDYGSLHELVEGRKATNDEITKLDPNDKKNKSKLTYLAKLQKARGKIVNEPKGS
jgi:hypothetical protein